MEIGIAVLSGVGITFVFFVCAFRVISREKDPGRIYKCWDTANELNRQKVEALDRIAEQLRIGNNIADR